MELNIMMEKCGCGFPLPARTFALVMKPEFSLFCLWVGNKKAITECIILHDALYKP